MITTIIRMLQLLGNCSFKGNYEYTNEQVEKIFRKLHSELEGAYSRFRCAQHRKGCFSLTDVKQPQLSDNHEFPSVVLPLPDGATLRASAVANKDYPSIDIWLQASDEEEKSVAFVEFNSDRDVGKELCIGVCESASEDPSIYVPFNK